MDGPVWSVHRERGFTCSLIAADTEDARPSTATSKEAKLLYNDLAPLPERGPKSEGTASEGEDAESLDARTVPVAEREFGAGRPTKRERRDTDRLRDL